MKLFQFSSEIKLQNYLEAFAIERTKYIQCQMWNDNRYNLTHLFVQYKLTEYRYWWPGHETKWKRTRSDGFEDCGNHYFQSNLDIFGWLFIIRVFLEKTMTKTSQTWAGVAEPLFTLSCPMVNSMFCLSNECLVISCLDSN